MASHLMVHEENLCVWLGMSACHKSGWGDFTRYGPHSRLQSFVVIRSLESHAMALARGRAMNPISCVLFPPVETVAGKREQCVAMIREKW